MMSMYRKNYIFFLIALSFFSFFCSVPMVSAQKSLGDAPELLESAGGATGIGADSKLGNLPDVIATAIRFVLSLLGTLMFVYMVYAGYLWMTAQGDEGAISTAKGIMVNTIIGFLVVISAWAITYLVQSRFQ